MTSGRWMAGRLLEDAGAVLDPAALGVGGTEVEPAQPGEGDRLRAHGARLQRDVDVAVGTRRALPRSVGRSADSQHLGVRRRVDAWLPPRCRPAPAPRRCAHRPPPPPPALHLGRAPPPASAKGEVHWGARRVHGVALLRSIDHPSARSHDRLCPRAVILAWVDEEIRVPRNLAHCQSERSRST